MKFGFVLSVVAVSISILGNAQASGRCVNCLIEKVGCSDGYQGKQTCSILFVEPIQTKAICANSSVSRMIINADSSGGKAMLSGAYTALATGIRVDAYGTNDCLLWDGHETLQILYLNKK